MVDIEVRPYQLANDAAPEDDVKIMIDRDDFTDPRQTTKAQLFAQEITDRTAMDNAIKAGAGLNSNGTMPSSPASNFLKNANFLAAGYSVNEYNALLLLDTAIQTLALSGELDILMTLTSAEILALNGTPVLKVAPSAIGTYYHITECVAKLDFISVPYVCNAAGIIARFVGGTDAIITLSQAFVQSVAISRKKFLVAEHEIPLATGIEFYAPVADPTNGDSNIYVRFRYQLLPDFSASAVTGSSCCVVPLTDTFVNADLTALGNLEIHHAQGSTQIKSLVIMDNTGYVTSYAYKTGTEAGADTTNYITVPIGKGIAGTWQWMLLF